MDLFMTARRLESKIARTLDDAAHRMMGSAPRDPLEVIHAVVERVEQEVLPAGRGRRVFPYNIMTVTLVAASPRERARYEALLEHSPTLRDRILDRLRCAGTEVPDIDVRLEFAPRPQEMWAAADFHVELERITPARPVPAPEAPVRDPIELTIVRGSTAQPSYVFALARIDLGRGREVRDNRNDVVRTNHVAFGEGADEVNTSVSRRHAHITCDSASADYRIFDDGSAQGTHVLRNGTTIVVRSGSRGIRLRDGDEIALGEARIRVNVPGR
jgi:pSer/pThr/pTyr-binding forkhead associated (FHA) protein